MADEAKTATAMRDIVKDASLLAEKRKELENLRADDTREWAQNREFYRGNQWVYWNSHSNQIESLGVEDGDKPRYKVRLTSNQVMPGVNELVAQMTKTRPVIRATPDSGGDRDVKAAQMGERLYEYWFDQFDLSAKLKSALVHAQISQGYWLITWDPLAGKGMKLMLNPNTGQPIVDSELADVYKDELRKAGVPVEEFEKTIYVGDISVQVLSGEQVWIDPTVSNFADAKYVICKYPMDADEVEARWGKKVTPDATVADSRPALMYSNRKEQRPKNVRNVFMLYHKPGPTLPKGKYVVWIEDPNQILFQSDWQFPFNELPIVHFPGIERPGSVMDEPRVTQVRPLQKEFNNTVSKVAMHKNLTMKPQMMAPIGSLRQRLTDEPGAVFEYAPIQGLAPDWRPIPPMPPYLQWYLEFIQGRIDRVFNRIPTERSALPARTDSGNLVELVQEAVADQLSPEILRMEDALARAGDLMIKYAQRFYEEPRLLKIRGAGGSVQVQKFLNSDLEGGFSFHAETGSGLPRTRAGQVQQIKEMVEMGVLPPNEALPYLPIAGLKSIQARLMADEDFAHRKVEQLLKGEPLNVPAMMQAIQAAQQGVNPQTQEAFQSMEEVQAFVAQAAMSPQPFENLGVTAGVLAQHMKSMEFAAYDPSIQQRFLQHFSMIQQQLQSQQGTEDQPKVSLALKGTVGPTVAAEMLNQKGIRSASAETMAEPPLETSVYDSVDKPDAEDAGNDPWTQAEQQLTMMQTQATHDLKQAKSMHELSSAVNSTDVQERDADARFERDEEAHQQQMRHREEAHQARLRQARNA